MANTVQSTVLKDKLYPKVSQSLGKKENADMFKKNIDQYMAKNIQSYMSPGPSTKPIFHQEDVANLLKVTGLEESFVKQCLSEVAGNNANWKNANTPFNAAIVLAIRYFTMKKNEALVKSGLLYMIANIYPFMYNKYYKFEPNPSVMAYTIANMSQRFKLKKSGNMLSALIEIAETCYKTHKPRLENGTDMDIVKFINDMTTRINSFMKKIRNEFENNIKSGNYLQSEKEDFSDEHYYEADTDSFAIDRITNKVLTNLVINGPDRKLVELAAKNSNVSVNTLQTSVLTLISEENREDIKRVIECLLSLYLNDNPDKTASIRDIGTNKFYVYCIKMYRQSNTTSKNVIIVKNILDKWIDDLGLKNKVGTVASLRNYRKAIFTFFVFTIEKLC